VSPVWDYCVLLASSSSCYSIESIRHKALARYRIWPIVVPCVMRGGSFARMPDATLPPTSRLSNTLQILVPNANGHPRYRKIPLVHIIHNHGIQWLIRRFSNGRLVTRHTWQNLSRSRSLGVVSVDDSTNAVASGWELSLEAVIRMMNDNDEGVKGARPCNFHSSNNSSSSVAQR
jgi:hypothetical protein